MSAVQIAVLMWTHCAIGWGFFIFQFWIPTYLSALGAHDLESMGMLSALPWAVSHPCHTLCPLTMAAPVNCMSATALRQGASVSDR